MRSTLGVWGVGVWGCGGVAVPLHATAPHCTHWPVGHQLHTQHVCDCVCMCGRVPWHACVVGCRGVHVWSGAMACMCGWVPWYACVVGCRGVHVWSGAVACMCGGACRRLWCSQSAGVVQRCLCDNPALPLALSCPPPHGGPLTHAAPPPCANYPPSPLLCLQIWRSEMMD